LCVPRRRRPTSFRGAKLHGAPCAATRSRRTGNSARCIAGSPSKRAWPKASNVALVTQFSSCRPALTRSRQLPFGVLAQRPRRNSARDVGAAPFLRRRSRNAAPNSSFTSPRLRHMGQAPRRVRFRNARLGSRACVNHHAPELVTSLSPSSQHAFERGVAVAQPTRNAPDRLQRPLPASRARATLV
jgi:hypothetical protein